MEEEGFGCYWSRRDLECCLRKRIGVGRNVIGGEGCELEWVLLEKEMWVAIRVLDEEYWSKEQWRSWGVDVSFCYWRRGFG